LCETELGVDGRQRIEAKLTSEAEEKIKTLQNNSNEFSKKRQNFRLLRTN
jgi:hypothetical protein